MEGRALASTTAGGAWVVATICVPDKIIFFSHILSRGMDVSLVKPT